jgi:hypothetical protein
LYDTSIPESMEKTASILENILFDSPTGCLFRISLTLCSRLRECRWPGPGMILLEDTVSLPACTGCIQTWYLAWIFMHRIV